jgi:hypothetical protein
VRKSGGRGRPSPSQRARHLRMVRTLEMNKRRRPTCGTRSSIIAEVKNGLSTLKAPCGPRVKAPTGEELLPQLHSGTETQGPQKLRSYQWAACGLADPLNQELTHKSSIRRHGRYARSSSSESREPSQGPPSERKSAACTRKSAGSVTSCLCSARMY